MTTIQSQPAKLKQRHNGTTKQNWKQRLSTEGVAESLSSQFDILPETARLLAQRGITTAEGAENFLNPALTNLLDPDKLMNMRRAVDRILDAIQKKEKIMIHGDYDADGVTSTAVLYRFFLQIGVQPEVYIPNRLEENHGLNEGAIQAARDGGIKLFITCDCGIGSAQQISELRSHHIDVIVTDHHLVPEEGPPQDAIVVNPSQDACTFGDQGMTGVGLAFYLIMGLRRQLREQGFFKDGQVEPNLKDFLDLVALGTIADQAPLLGQNRILVKHGLPKLSNTDKAGLRVLINLSMPADRAISVQDVAFNLAPKINAAGRLGQAREAFELLVETDPVRAAVLARKLVNYNEERRRIEEKHFREAIQQVEEFYDAKAPLVGLVLYRPDWHLGVLGLVAQKITQRYRCPTILLSQQGERLKGSGRSLGELSLIEQLRSARALLLSYGGHSMAAGVSLKEENLAAFRAQFTELLSKVERQADADCQWMDGSLNFEAVTERFLDELQLLEPFGEANPEPLFMCSSVAPKDLRRMGEQQQHLRMMLADNQGKRLAAVGFSMAEYAKFTDRLWNVLATPEWNLWQGRRSIQLRLRAISPE